MTMDFLQSPTKNIRMPHANKKDRKIEISMLLRLTLNRTCVYHTTCLYSQNTLKSQIDTLRVLLNQWNMIGHLQEENKKTSTAHLLLDPLAPVVETLPTTPQTPTLLDPSPMGQTSKNWTSLCPMSLPDQPDMVLTTKVTMIQIGTTSRQKRWWEKRGQLTKNTWRTNLRIQEKVPKIMKPQKEA